MSVAANPRIPIAVFASGQGSNFEAIASAVAAGKVPAEIVAMVTDQPSAPVIEKARNRGIRSLVIPPEGKDRRKHEEKILKELAPFSPHFLVMAGYMRIVTPFLLDAFRSEKGYTRIVNIHPSLLPAFPGMGGYAQAFRYGAKVAGVTVHLVDPEVDQGPICAQEAFSIDLCRSEAEVEALGHQVEHRLYPSTLAWVLPERFEIVNRPGSQGATGAGAPGLKWRLCVCPI